MEAVSCGGVVIHEGKVLLLYRQKGKRVGWVLPKGTVEKGETFEQTALREVKEEAGVTAEIQAYLGNFSYRFKVNNEQIDKTVHWYLMTTNSFYCKPQAEEFFMDAGFYKKNEAFHLLKFYNEKKMVTRAYREYEVPGFYNIGVL